MSPPTEDDLSTTILQDPPLFQEQISDVPGTEMPQHAALVPENAAPDMREPSVMPHESFVPDNDMDFEFLWDDAQPHSGFLPADFLDTGFSLADISQQYLSLTHQGQANLGLTKYPVYGAAGQQPQDESVAPRTHDRVQSRLPSLEPDGQRPCEAPGVSQLSSTNQTSINATKEQVPLRPWRISPAEYHKIHQDLTALTTILPRSFTIPSRHTFSRYLEGYFRGFHDHLPFLHASTFCAGSLGPELLLSLAAVGALYRFEHAKGYELYHIARTIIDWRLKEHGSHALSRLTNTSPVYAGLAGARDDGEILPYPTDDGPEGDVTSPHGLAKLRLLQTQIILLALTSWSDRAVVPHGIVLASQVAMSAREVGIASPETPESTETSWEEWIIREERRRTLFVAYMLPSLQSVAFNIPPMILNQEVAINMPASAAEFKARDAAEWTRARTASTGYQGTFREALAALCSMTPVHRQQPVSAFGNYALIHGLVQKIFFARSSLLSLPDGPDPLPPDFVNTMEMALRAWQESWEASHESTLDPSSPKGPLGFNATALLRLAYIRLNTNGATDRKLMSRDPQRIAHAFIAGMNTVCTRSAHLDRAILQCIHALSVPVRVGIAWVARTQTLNWSMQHSLCNLECAFLLTHWLQTLAQCVDVSGMEALRPDERKLLKMVASLVRETDLATMLESGQSETSRIRSLAVASMCLWAETFRGFHVFEIVHAIGAGLSIAADILKETYTSSINGHQPVAATN